MLQSRTARRAIAHRIPGVAVLLLLTSIQVVPQENKGSLDIHVTRRNSTEGIADIAITLLGPYQGVDAGALAGLYKPNPALTPAMKEQIDALIASAPPTVTTQVVANAAIRMEAQLLGLPAPTFAPVNAATAAAAQPPQVSGLTDASGHYIVPNISPGRYQIRAQREGYFGAPPAGTTAISLSTIANTTANVDAAQTVTTVNIAMVRGATVSGRVRGPDGQPLSGVQVYAYTINYQNNREVLSTLNSKATDDRGDYRLFWLPPGDYFLGVTPRRAGTLPGAQDTYARTFFPGTSNPRTAARVKVPEGGEVSGIDIGVRGDATGKISGHIVTSIVLANGQPAQASTFYLMPREINTFMDTAGMNFPNSAANRTNGQFEIRGVLPGSYELITTVSNPANGSQSVGRVKVDVGGGNVDDVALVVKTGVEVKAHLTLDTGTVPFTMAAPPARSGIIELLSGDGITTVISGARGTDPASTAPVPTPNYRVQLRSMEAYPQPFDSAAQQYTYDPSSSMFVFPNIPEGRYYTAITGLPLMSYVADVLVGDKSIYDDGFEVGGLSGVIEVKVSSNGAKVTGVVLDAAQQPFATARVALIPAPERRQNIALYKTSTSDAKGNFTFNGVAPGEYRAFAWQSLPGTAYMNAEFIKPYEVLGKPISVMQGTTETLDLKVIP